MSFILDALKKADATRQDLPARVVVMPQPVPHASGPSRRQLLLVGGTALLVVVAKTLFGLRFDGSWLSVGAAFTLVGAAFFSVGYLIASVASTARIAQVVGQVLFFPMMFLSGAALPLQLMPEGVRSIAELLPMTHAVLLLQNLWFGGGWGASTVQVAVLVGTLLLGLVASARLFRWE